MENKFKKINISAIVLLVLCPLVLGAMQENGVKPSLLQRERLETKQRWGNDSQYGPTDKNVSLDDVDDHAVFQQFDEIDATTVKVLKDYITSPNYGEGLRIPKLMAALGVNFNVKDESGNTPLHTAISEGHGNVASFLCANGADVNAKNDKGETPFHTEAECQYSAERLIKKFKLFLKYGAHINSQTNDGKTALAIVASAATGPNAKVINFLINHGAIISNKVIASVTNPVGKKCLQDVQFRQNMFNAFKNNKKTDIKLIK